MDVMIFVLVNLLFGADIICTLALRVKPLEIGNLGIIPCDQVEKDPEIRIVQWYKSRRIDAFENGDPSLAQWADGRTESQPNYHMDITTFSLVIEKATLGDEGLFKCSVERGDLYTQSFYFTRTVMYALPQMDPEITLDPDLNRVNCTVEHVKPLVFPVFNFDCSHASTETYAVLNEDGTYTTSVSCTLPRYKSASRINCSFFYLHYQRVGSLGLRDTTTDGLMENKATTVSPMGTSVIIAGDGCTCITIGYQIALIGSYVMLAAFLLFLMTMLWRKHHRREQKCNEAKRNSWIEIASVILTSEEL